MQPTTIDETAEQETKVVDADAPCTAEAAECQCPDFCERDHDLD